MHSFKASKPARKDEQGISLVLALFMGLILISGVTALMIRQLMARKLGAAESYQQMAENAAINGFNRILGEVNRDSDSEYRGYFLTLRNDEQGWGWRNPNSANFPLVELCTDTSLSMTADPLSGSQGDADPVLLSNADTSITTQRQDGKDDIQLYYRLRGYALAGDGTGADEGTFQIEGIVQREEDANDDTKYFARALLTRSLYIDQRVAGEGDWAVMAGYYMRLGNTSVQGPGKILLDVSDAAPYQAVGGCSPNKLLQKVGANNNNLASRIWPVLDRGLPAVSVFERDKAKDTMNSNSSNIRVWSFDDSAIASGASSSNLPCGKIACVRREDQSQFSAPVNINQNQSTIILKENDLCSGSSSFECHMYVEHMDLSQTEILIETGSSSKPRPIVVHLELPKQGSKRIKGMSGNIKLSNNSLFCGVDNGETQCNIKPERFILASSAGSDALTCNATTHVLNFSGDTLPNAIIHMQKGTVKPSGVTTLHGLVWAQNICANTSTFTLNSALSGQSVVKDANTLWQWEEKGFPGYGQMVVRGIRGTGLDTFRRW